MDTTTLSGWGQNPVEEDFTLTDYLHENNLINIPEENNIEEIIPNDIRDDDIIRPNQYFTELCEERFGPWDPDSYFYDCLQRHYAAVAIQNSWRSHYLFR